MKYLLCFWAVLCSISVCCKAATPADIEDCAIEHNVDLRYLHESHTDKRFIPTQEMMCFAACVFKKDGILTEEGKLSEKAMESLVVKSCEITDGKDACETAGMMMDCVSTNPW